MDRMGKDVLTTWIKDQLGRWWMSQDPVTPFPNFQKPWHPPNPWTLDAMLNEVRAVEVCVAQLTEISFPIICHKVTQWSEVAQSCLSLWDTWAVAYQAPPSMGFSRQEYWSGLPFPSPRIIPTQGSNPGLPHCRQTLYPLSHQGSPCMCICVTIKI